MSERRFTAPEPSWHHRAGDTGEFIEIPAYQSMTGYIEPNIGRTIDIDPDDERHVRERMTPDERAAFWAQAHRLRAAAYEMAAARDRLTATEIETAASMRRFAEAWDASVRAELASHPDLAEVDLQLDGYYGDPGDR